MHKRPTLQEAKLFLTRHSPDTIREYEQLVESHGEFFAARFIVDIVDHFNHLQEKAING